MRLRFTTRYIPAGFVCMCHMCVCMCARMNRENSAGSEMSKLLSFGYLDTSPQSTADNRKSSASHRYQPSSAGLQTTRQSNLVTGYQASTSPQSSAGTKPHHYSDSVMSQYKTNMSADRQSTAGTQLSRHNSTSQPPASSSAV